MENCRTAGVPATLRAGCGIFLLSAAGFAQDGGLELQVRETRLELTAALDYEKGRLEATAALTVENVSERPVNEVSLLLGRLMTVQRVWGTGGGPLDFEQDVLTFVDWPERQVNRARVRLPVALAPGEETLVSLAYSGWVVPYTETGMLYVRDRIDEEFTILRAEAYPFPVVGEPSWQANRAAPERDFAYRVAISVPEHLTVANGGRLIERTAAEGIATWVYESTAPTPFLLLPIADYTLLEERGVRVFAFEKDADEAARLLGKALQAMTLLEQWLGPLAGPAELAIMEIPDGWGSQASLTAGIIQTASAFRQPERRFELYHELSHLWNAPDAERPSPRWNEGLAVYLQYRLAQVLDGWEGMEEAVDRAAARVLQAIEENPSYRDVAFRDYGRRRMTDLSYGTGFAMFYLLDELIGTEALDRALANHYRSHRAAGGSFDDLVGHLQAATATDLGPFFEDWHASSRWQAQLASRGSISAMLESYRASTRPAGEGAERPWLSGGRHIPDSLSPADSFLTPDR